jgi:hypothetical protein
MIESSGPVGARTYADWLKEDSGFRDGYLFGVMEALSGLAEVKDARSYQRCFNENKISSEVGMNIVDSFLSRSPDSNSELNQLLM